MYVKCLRAATPVVTDAITVKRLRHGGAVEVKWRPSASDGTGLILYVVEGLGINTDTTDDDTETDHWTLLTRVCSCTTSYHIIMKYRVAQCKNKIPLESIQRVETFAKNERATKKLSYCKDDRAMGPIYGCPENFRESLSTQTAAFAEIFNGLLFRSIL